MSDAAVEAHDDAVWMLAERAADGRAPVSKREQEADADPGQWFACHEPERPFDSETCLHDCCRACLLAVRVAIANGYLWASEDGASVVVAMTARLDEYGDADDA